MIEPLTGGLKSQMVSRVQMTLDSVVKIDTKELKSHKSLMEMVNKKYEKTFPEILQLKKIDNKKFILIMEQMRKFEPFLNYIYQSNTNNNQLKILTQKAFDYIRNVHRTPIKSNNRLQTTRNPYSTRIKSKIDQVVKTDPPLAKMLTKNGVINGVKIRSINSTLFKKVNKWLINDLKNVELTLTHGDSHLGNILFRGRGFGYSCRLIDPNPLIGISDPIYDFGKLLHWVEEVGWAKFQPKKCSSVWKTSKNSWTLDYSVIREPLTVKRRRKIVMDNTMEFLNKTKFLGDWQKRLKISLASSHLGLAAILIELNQETRKKICFCSCNTVISRKCKLK
ncbi:MAG: aminoglycoside phosphotransferase family protein [Ignavibacteriales bacterium]|nr:aminoglycoside phosphotransferase family protein [Ignavibacteriales bacterium]